MLPFFNQDDSNPMDELEFSHICQETFQQFWKDESATYSCNFLMMGLIAGGMIFLSGWLPV